jgi:hypothetical protein
MNGSSLFSILSKQLLGMCLTWLSIFAQDSSEYRCWHLLVCFKAFSRSLLFTWIEPSFVLQDSFCNRAMHKANPLDASGDGSTSWSEVYEMMMIHYDTPDELVECPTFKELQTVRVCPHT